MYNSTITNVTSCTSNANSFSLEHQPNPLQSHSVRVLLLQINWLPTGVESICKGIYFSTGFRKFGGIHDLRLWLIKTET